MINEVNVYDNKHNKKEYIINKINFLYYKDVYLSALTLRVCNLDRSCFSI